jgi:hypothetical protein
MDPDKLLPQTLLDETIGISIEIEYNHFDETPGGDGSVNTFQEIVFQINEEDPEVYAVGILYTLSLMSFTFAAPRGFSENEFVPDEQWSLGHFLQGLEFRHNHLCFSADYVSGRLMKTDITYQSGGRVRVLTSARGRSAETWLTHLQGRRHLTPVK